MNATSVGANEILLEWNMPAGNGTTFTGYQIQRWDPTAGTGNDGAWSADIDIPGADTTLYTDRGADDSPLAAGKTYSYRIRANGGTPGAAVFDQDAGVEDAMASASTAAGAPGKPTLTPVAIEDIEDVGSIMLTIAATEGATSLELQRWYDGAWSTIMAPAADADEYTDSGLMPGKKYYYALRATNSNGTGPWSDVVNAVAKADNPDVPGNLDANPVDESSIRIEWDAPEDHGSPITGYELQQWDFSGTGEWDTPNLLGDDYTATEFFHTGLTAGVTYVYRIRAVSDTDSDNTIADEEPASDWSADDDDMEDGVSATTHADVPEAPVITNTTIPDSDDTASSLTVSWTEVPVADTGGSDVTGYQVYKWDGSSWVHEADRAADADSYEDTGLAAGTKHYYIVRATNDQGAGKWSEVISGTTDSAAPDAPVLTATARGTNAIQLSWTVPNLNGQADFVGYILQKWNGTTFEAITDGTSPVPQSALDTTTTLYIDSDVVPGTQYWYQIATNAGGIDNNSDFSAVKTATTIAAPPGRPTVTGPAADDSKHDSVKLTWMGPDIDTDTGADSPEIDADSFASNGSAVIHYEVQMWDTSGSTNQWTRLALISATHTEYTHKNLDAETRYIYRVRAQNRAPGAAGGFGSWSTVISVTTTAEPKE